jgi:hypothetical protein
MDGTKVFSGFYGGHMQLSENKGSNRRSDFSTRVRRRFSRESQIKTEATAATIIFHRMFAVHSPKQITDEWIRSEEG